MFFVKKVTYQTNLVKRYKPYNQLCKLYLSVKVYKMYQTHVSRF